MCFTKIHCILHFKWPQNRCYSSPTVKGELFQPVLAQCENQLASLTIKRVESVEPGIHGPKTIGPVPDDTDQRKMRNPGPAPTRTNCFLKSSDQREPGPKNLGPDQDPRKKMRPRTGLGSTKIRKSQTYSNRVIRGLR